jgi:hypothetical protein
MSSLSTTFVAITLDSTRFGRRPRRHSAGNQSWGVGSFASKSWRKFTTTGEENKTRQTVLHRTQTLAIQGPEGLSEIYLTI